MQNLPNTRQSLIVRLKSNSDAAWSEFLTIYEQAIVRYCCARGLQDADARDASQEVLSALFDKIASWDPAANRGSFRAWLFRVARNIAVDRIRARANAPAAVDEATMAGLARSSAMEQSAFLFEYRRSLFAWAADEVRREVQEATWNCFLLTAIEDRNAREVAKQMGVSVGSVYTAKCRVVARIRDKVARFSEDDEIAPLADETLANEVRGFLTASRNLSVEHEQD